MAVNTQHKDYMAMAAKWQRTRDVVAGQDEIYSKGAMYLPRLADQTDGEYASYLKRTPFYNATARTIAGLQGMLFRKPPQTDVPDTIKPMLQDIDMGGTPLHIFALEVSEECLTVGRVGIFVDFPEVDTSVLTAADALEMNLRPLMKLYETESIINWKTRQVNNATVLSMVVLQEEHCIPVDEFTDKSVTKYRVLDLIDEPQPDGSVKALYRVRLFHISDKSEDVLESVVTPIINGSTLDYIPFYFIGVDDVSCEVDEPPLIDLVDMNLSHFRISADYEHGCHFTGLPTPVISGYQPTEKGEKFYIGSMTAWVFPNPNATAKYLEFTGQGLKALENNMTRKEHHMAILGARMLESTTKSAESADTASIHRGGEQSMLASIAQAMSIGIQKAMTTFVKFAGVTSDVKFDLNRDFFPMAMDPLALTALVAGWQNGAYGYATLHSNLKQGEIVPLEQTVDEAIAELKLNPPMIPGGTKVNQDNAPRHEVTMPTQRQLQTPPI